MNDLIPIPENQQSSLFAEAPATLPPSVCQRLQAYETERVRVEYIFSQLSKMSVREAMETWIPTLSPLTGKSYKYALRTLQKLQIITLDCDLRQFSMINHEIVVDTIKNHAPWKEATRQARAAAYVSFTGFLERQTRGIIKKAVIVKTGANKTFFQVREKVKTRSLSKRQTKLFLKAIDRINARNGLIAKIMLQGGKRQNEVLTLQIKNINFSKNQIIFEQSKTRERKKVTVINYPPDIMKQLKRYTGKRAGLAFVTRTGRQIHGSQLYKSFVKAGKKARIPFQVSPHVLRVTLVTRLKELRIQDTDIMKITGHSNARDLAKYDKADLGYNATLHHNFVKY